MPRMDTDRVQSEREQLFNHGLQYHIAGRYAAFAELNPVAGSLCHHAVEMCLKAYLCANFTLNQLAARKQFGHDLKKLWDEFKAATADPTLSRFDRTVADLDAFEGIRYPDDILARGMAASIGTSRGSTTLWSATGPVPSYALTIQDIDDLVEVIFTKASVNPAFFTNSLNRDAKDYLGRNNTTSVV